MKVLYIVTGIAPASGWGTEFIQNLIFSLSKKDIVAHIITPTFVHTPPTFYKWKTEMEEKYSVKIHTVKLPAFTNNNLKLQLYISPFFMTLKSLSLVRKEKFDLVHEFTSTPVILFRSFLLKIFFGLPSIITLSVYNSTFLGSLKWFKYFNFGKYYLIPSKHMLNQLINLGINSQKLIYSPPGIFTEKFKKLDKISSRKKLNLPLENTIITYYGTLTKEKGINTLIQLANDLSSKKLDKYVIAIYSIWRGESQPNKLIATIKSHKNIILKNEFVNIPTLLSASDILVFPQETGHGTVIPPISIIEAVALEKTVLAKNTPGVSDFLPLKNIFTNNLINKILEFSKNNSIFITNRKMIENYNMEISTNLHLNIYKKILNEK